jgi:glycogen debranching enzyme
MLTHDSPSHVRSIAEAVVVKDEDLYFLTDVSGSVPLGGQHGFGLYYHDCRFLNGYELRLGASSPDVLAASGAQGYAALLQLTGAKGDEGGGEQGPRERIGVRWDRVVDGKQLALREVLSFRNFGVDPVELQLSLCFGAGFEDIFLIRGLLSEKLGTVHPPEWKDGTLTFAYDGSDGCRRSLRIHFSPAPAGTNGAAAHFRVSLTPQQTHRLHVTLQVAEWDEQGREEPRARDHGGAERASSALQSSHGRWLHESAEVKCDSRMLNHVLRRSLLDLRTLRTTLHGREFFAAGVPWFVTLFGRDSIISALQTLAYNPSVAEQTLRLLAGYQGREVDDWKDEQPGKILHELRVGELARRGAVPYTPYYGSIDATPLFLVLLGRHAAWSGDLALFEELHDAVELALRWIAAYGDLDGDGYVEYRSDTEHGLVNQGWKDSGNAMVNADGSLARPPIAPVEVQGYVYLAKTTLAGLYIRRGEGDRAEALRREAEELRERFNRDFWLEDLGFYALALQGKGGKRPAAVVSSNPGHALWTGIADDEKARRTVDLLMDDSMFNGWGVRTLSEKERRYNPVGYHLGTVWPHDNSILAAGFRRYGFHAEALRIFDGIVDAAAHFPHGRLPEVFAGFRRRDYGIPVRYPVACHPQAWAAGSVPFLLSTLLGLEPDGFSRRLRVVHPLLPERVGTLELDRVRVGKGSAGLRFRRDGGRTRVEVLRAEGVEVVVVDDGAGEGG